MNSTDFWLQLQTLESKILNVKAEAWKNHQLLNNQQSQLKELERQVIALKKMLPRPTLEFDIPLTAPSPELIIIQSPTQSEGDEGDES